MEHFITKISIQKLRHLENIGIDVSHDERKHLLLTGKNGTGKTTLLKAMEKTLAAINAQKWNGYKNFIHSQNTNKFNQMTYGNFKNGIDILFNEEKDLDALFAKGAFVTAFFAATRTTSMEAAHGVEDIKLDTAYAFSHAPANLLLKYLVHLKTQQAYAISEKDAEAADSIEAWFARFEAALRELMDDDTMWLEYNYKNYNFLIHQNGKEPVGFNELSDGYSAAIRIVSDLILRMEQNWLLKGTISTYNIEGIALIDELETHLHIELQRKILPFLTKFFPRIQFIVSTHSPYVLTSISDAVIYDLEKQVRFEDMSNLSIDDVAEAFFGSEDYSDAMGGKLKRYQELLAKHSLTNEEKVEKTELTASLRSVSGKLASRIRSEFDIMQREQANG